eukprot:8247470-Lingulodinium_polyedra.AAC.1
MGRRMAPPGHPCRLDGHGGPRLPPPHPHPAQGRCHRHSLANDTDHQSNAPTRCGLCGRPLTACP